MSDGTVLMVQPTTPSTNKMLAAVATELSCVVKDVVTQVEQSTEEPGLRVKKLGPLIERQRAVLAAHGVKSFKEYDSLLASASDAEVLAACQRLEKEQEKWSSVLAGLEAGANLNCAQPLKLGEAGPEFRLLEAASGSMVSLSQLLSEGPSCVVLVWLRHFG